MVLLRHELNMYRALARSNQVQSQRYINDLGAQKKTVETQLQHALEDRQRLGSHLQGQIDYHATNAQRLQATLENLQNQPPAQPTIDPAIYGELENLRALRMSLEAENANLHGQMNKQKEDQQQLQQTLAKKNDELEETKTNLKSSMDTNKKLSDQVTNLEHKNTADSGQFEVVTLFIFV